MRPVLYQGKDVSALLEEQGYEEIQIKRIWRDLTALLWEGTIKSNVKEEIPCLIN